MIGLDGSGARTLYRSEEVTNIDPDRWSADGKHILAELSRSDGTLQLAWISVADGSRQVLKTFNWRPYAMHVRLSPDRRWIAYDFPTDGRGARARGFGDEDIFLLAADGSREITLVDHPGDDDIIEWTPDGSGLLFRSDRSGVDDAWFVRVGPDGKPTGDSIRVKSNIGEIHGRGFTRDGTLYFARWDELWAMYNLLPELRRSEKR